MRRIQPITHDFKYRCHECGQEIWFPVMVGGAPKIIQGHKVKDVDRRCPGKVELVSWLSSKVGG